MKAKPIGTKRLNHSGYVQVKTKMGQRRWPFEHRVIWEAANGIVPGKHVIHHKNGDRTDNRLENLELCASNSRHFLDHHREISRENMRRIGLAGRGRPKSAETRTKMSIGQQRIKAHPIEIQKKMCILRSKNWTLKAISRRVHLSESAVWRFLLNHGQTT